MGRQLLGDVCSSSELDKCVIFINVVRNSWTQEQNNWLCFGFPQAELDVPVYMELPIGMDVPRVQDSQKSHVLHHRQSLHGLKQASANWYDMLKQGLTLWGFNESIADPCIFIKQNDSKPQSLIV